MRDMAETLCTYNGVISEEVWKNIAKCGGDVHDLTQEACVAAIKAIQTHQADRGTLGKRVRSCVRFALLNFQREERKQQRMLPLASSIQEVIPHTFSAEEFLSELSEDARAVIDLMFDPDPNFWRPKFRIREDWLRVLTTRLRHQCQWSTPRITEAFTCIRNALA